MCFNLNALWNGELVSGFSLYLVYYISQVPFDFSVIAMIFQKEVISSTF